MAPITSAFAVYQKKRLQRLQRLKKRMKKSKTQVRSFNKRALPGPSNNEEWDTDQDTVIMVHDDGDSTDLISAKKFKKDPCEPPGVKIKRDANHMQVDWCPENGGELSGKLDEEEFRMPAKRKNKLNSAASILLSRKLKTSPLESSRRKKNKPVKLVMKNEVSPSNNDVEGPSDADTGAPEPETEDDVSVMNEDEESNNKDPSISDSIREGEELFSWLIFPLSQTTFFTNAWEIKPMHIRRRNSPGYYRDLVTTKMIDNALGKQHLAYSKNIDITEYTNGKRKTLNPTGRATRKEVWDFYNKGCSIRLLNPQTFFPGLGVLLATLQEYFCSMVGANAYLTPPDAQGFAPHYDDIEAFVLQIEGKKRWKIYKPRPGEELPRESSADFLPEDIQEDPIMDLTLNEGEMLYFPRGFIHEAHTVPGHHSLHVTVSCYQHLAWIDYFEKIVTAALATAGEDKEFRRGLPLGYLHVMGVAHSDLNTVGRNTFMADFNYLKKKFNDLFQVDATVDQLGRQFMHDALPPMLGSDEMKLSIHGVKTNFSPEGKNVICRKLTKDMKVKLVRATCLRLVIEDTDSSKVSLYHCAKNSLVYHETEEHMVEVDSDQAFMVEYLQHVYPRFAPIRSLPTDKTPMSRKVSLATTLFNHGLLLVEK